MKRIMIIGSGGAGKSTLARRLSEILNLEVVHLDRLFWKPGWIAVSKDEQKNIQNELVKKESWIIDGNYGGTLDIRLNAADTIIFLDFPRLLCVYRVIKRRLKYSRRPRPDMREGCKERIDFSFIKWVWDFPKTKRPSIVERLIELEYEKEVILLKSPKEVRRFIKSLELRGK